MMFSKKNKKRLRRLRLITGNAAWQAIPPLGNLLAALLVVRFTSEAHWGRLVTIMLALQLFALLSKWGNRDFLLRRFSRKPGAAKAWFQTVLRRRLPFLLLLPLIPIILHSSIAATISILLWGTALFFYRSLEAVVIFRKRFLLIVKIESAALLWLLSALYFWRSSAEFAPLLEIFAMAAVLRGMVAVWIFRDWFMPVHPMVSITGFWKQAGRFFLVDASGMLNSRIDLYVLALMLGAADLGRYQILVALLIYLQTFANLLVTPFLKEFYRLPQVSLEKFRRRLFGVGWLTALVATPLLALLLNAGYGFGFPSVSYLLAALFVPPVFGYVTVVYRLFRLNRAQRVVQISFAGMAVKAGLAVLLIPLWGITGAIAAGTVTQWLQWLLFRYADKTSPAESASAGESVYRAAETGVAQNA